MGKIHFVKEFKTLARSKGWKIHNIRYPLAKYILAKIVEAPVIDVDTCRKLHRLAEKEAPFAFIHGQINEALYNHLVLQW
jgi:hypothetical protein